MSENICVYVIENTRYSIYVIPATLVALAARKRRDTRVFILRRDKDERRKEQKVQFQQILLY